jgi:hypothetical protein
MARCEGPKGPIDDAMRIQMARAQLKSREFKPCARVNHWSARNTGLISVALDPESVTPPR